MIGHDFIMDTYSDKTPRQVLASIWKAAAKAGWIIVNDNDYTGMLRNHNRATEIKSIGLCHPDVARMFLEANLETALCMPCNVIVYIKDGQTRICAVRPSRVVFRLFPELEPHLSNVVQQAENELLQILKNAT